MEHAPESGDFSAAPDRSRRLLERLLAVAQPEAGSSPLAFWQARVLHVTCQGAVFLGFIGYLVNAFIAYQSGQWPRIGAYTATYLGFVAIAFAPRLSYPTRARVVLLLCFLLGLLALATGGPVGSGRGWLAFFSCLTSLLFGFRAGLKAMVVNMVAFFVYSGLLLTNRLEFLVPHAVAPESWLKAALGFLLLNTVATLGIGLFVDRLQRSLGNERELVEALKAANEKLAGENRERREAQERLKSSERALHGLAEELEARVAVRTMDLKAANRRLEQEVAERRQAEELINSSRQSLRRLYRRLQQVREEERRRIAREVHDELGQNLTALRIDLDWLERRRAGDGAPLREKLQSMTRVVDETLERVQRISTELRPGVLDALVLSPAVEWLRKDFEKRTGIDCTAEIEPEEIDLEPGRRTAAFRILQEALTNAARHARATRVRVTLRREDGRLELKIVDNGIGISDELANSPAAIGLCGIRERADEYGGEARIRGRDGAGTEIAVSIPIG